MALEDFKIANTQETDPQTENFTADGLGVRGQAAVPNLTAAEMQKKVEEIATKAIIPAHNAAMDYIQAEYQKKASDEEVNANGHRVINVGEPTTDTDGATKGYVDGLIAEEAETRGNAVTALQNSKEDASNKKTDLLTDSDTYYPTVKAVGTAIQTEANARANGDNARYTKVEADALLGNKVDKDGSKGLSTNDYTDAEKTKVENNTNARHTHDNFAILDTIPLEGGTGRVLKKTADGTEWGTASISASWTDITDKPTTLGGYGITDAYTAAMTDSLLVTKQPMLTNTDLEIQDAVSKKHEHANASILATIPNAGTAGYVLKKTANGSEWGAPPASATWGNIGGTLSNQTDLQNALDGKANANNTYTKSEVNNLVAGKADAIVATILGNILPNAYDSSKTYNKGDVCMHENKLMQCTNNATTGTWNASYWTQVRIGSVAVLDYNEI